MVNSTEMIGDPLEFHDLAPPEVVAKWGILVLEVIRMRKTMIFLASVVGSTILATSALAATSYETEVEYGVNMRSQPSLSGKVIRMLKRGEDIHVVGEASGNWLKIRTKSGTIGYISNDDKYTNYDASAARYDTEVTYGVNLRTAPSASSKVIRMLQRGEDIRVVSEAGGNWLKVQTKSGTTGYISDNEKYTDYDGASSGSGSGGSATTPKRSAIVSTAKSYKGDFKYDWGAEPWNTNYKKADCSSYMELVFRKHDIDLPRTSRQQAKEGTYVSKKNLKPGDLVFFDTNDNGSINHVGLYIGGGDFIHASPIFDGVGVSDINSNYWSDHYVTARNVL